MNVGLFGPFDLSRRDGNTIRILMQARGLLENGFRNFTLFGYEACLDLDVTQRVVGQRLFPKKFPFRQKLPPLGVSLAHAHHYHGAMLVREPYIVDMPSFTMLQTDAMYRVTGAPLKRIFMRRVFNPLVQIPTESRVIRNARHVIAASENIKRHIMETLPGVSTPITVITNPIDPRAYEPSPCHDLRVGLSSSDFEDTIDSQCLEFAVQIAKRAPDVEFLVAGPMGAAKKALLETMPNMKALGRLPFEDYRRFLRDISVFLMPYGNYDYGGSKFKLLEAGACGLAVASTRAGAIGFEPQEVLLIEDTPNALAEKIRSLKTPALRRERGMALRHEIESRHDYLKEAEKLIAVYEEAAL
jgi:glycosyltransferase involved in cell wall biosynthesis